MDPEPWSTSTDSEAIFAAKLLITIEPRSALPVPPPAALRAGDFRTGQFAVEQAGEKIAANSNRVVTVRAAVLGDGGGHGSGVGF